MSKFYITTPIYYINDQPHIGHAYATIAADVLARFHRQHGDEVFFLTGTDENSQKTVKAAAEKDIQSYTDEMAEHWRKTWQDLEISHDNFVRTTSAEHKKAVYDLIKKIEAAGDIYKGTYEGWYCVDCEEFKREDELLPGHKCPIHKKLAEKIKENNYFFKLSKYQKPLLEHFEKHRDFVQPQSRRNEILAFINRGLEDISISRATQKWGIPYPGDEKQVVYVWFDALINYLTGIGYPGKEFESWWPANVQLVGKDLIKFHCAIWPAMLMSAGLPVPEVVFAHGFFTVDGEKISKSLGNAIDPVELAGGYGVDALRYFLLREIPFGHDGEFSRERFAIVYNTELANELGNLVQRTASMIKRYFDGDFGTVPGHSHDTAEYTNAMGYFQLDRALGAVWELVRELNQLIEQEKPWELAKSDPEQLRLVLGHVLADLNLIATLLLPFLPQAAGKIEKTFADGKIDDSVGILFPKLEDQPLEHTQLDLPK